MYRQSSGQDRSSFEDRPVGYVMFDLLNISCNVIMSGSASDGWDEEDGVVRVSNYQLVTPG